MKETKNGSTSVMMLITSMLIFGTIGIFRRHIPVSSGFLAFSRGLLGTLFLLLFLRLRGRPFRITMGRRKALLFALSGAAMGINWILLFEAYNFTSVSIATLCYYMQPTIVILLSPLFFRESLTPRKILCAAVSVFGMVLVSGVIGGAPAQGNDLKGIVFGLGAAALYASVVILNKKIGTADPYEKTVIQLFSAALVMLPYLLLTRDRSFIGITGTTAVLLLTVGLIHTGIAYVLYFGSMDGVSAQTIALLSYIDPVSALLFSAAFLRESLTPEAVLGAILILGAAYAAGSAAQVKGKK